MYKRSISDYTFTNHKCLARDIRVTQNSQSDVKFFIFILKADTSRLLGTQFLFSWNVRNVEGLTRDVTAGSTAQRRQRKTLSTRGGRKKGWLEKRQGSLWKDHRVKRRSREELEERMREYAAWTGARSALEKQIQTGKHHFRWTMLRWLKMNHFPTLINYIKIVKI